MKASLQDTRYPHYITLRYVTFCLILRYISLRFYILRYYLGTLPPYLVLPTVLGSVLIYPKNLYSKGSKKGVAGLDWVRLELYIPILRTKCTTPLVWIGFKLRIGSNYIVSVLSVCSSWKLGGRAFRQRQMGMASIHGICMHVYISSQGIRKDKGVGI
ncbi:uncharacterized protein F4817DRAFT_211667 [Daldinia loculata]|uniref:uncharacterized protein n=1 Tax=Daldinia loculata TaxID=103429 RepID=UPI0020C402CF|nr:uncharacterized protein F4817DRAFT_211667 [Daldinia loculata]KAI1650854.1 hypothetical protein F4817DRAFT_211667 [Daldinia loculata]